MKKEIPPSSRKVSEGTPFVGFLYNTTFNRRLRELESRPDKIVRIQSIPENRRQEYLDLFSHGKKLLDELRDRYGIKVAHFDMAIGKDEGGQEKMFTIIDKVFGESIEELSELSLEIAESLDIFFANLARYFCDKYNNHDNYLSDVHGHQVMYGHTAIEDKNSIYVVDTDPYIDKMREGESIDLLNGLGWLLDDILNNERKISGWQFQKGRKALLRALTAVSPNDPNFNRVNEIKKALAVTR